MQLTLNQDEVTKAVVEALSVKYPGLVNEDSLVEFTVDEDTLTAHIDISGGVAGEAPSKPVKKQTRKRKPAAKVETPEPADEPEEKQEEEQEELPFSVDEPDEEPEPENNEGEPEPSTPLFGS